MRRILSLLFSLILAAQTAFALAAAPAQDAVKTVQPTAAAQALTDEDVLKMFGAKLSTEVIVEKIKSSACDFDTSPEALQRLKDAGLPDSLILVMVMLPKGSLTGAGARAAKVSVKVPEGTVIELETSYTVNSQLVRKGDAISFRVANPVIVEGSVVIEKGATATAVVTKAERNGHFGRAGRITWEMREVTAMDGTRIPLQFMGHVVGESHGAKVAAQTVLLGVGLGILGPLSLLHGFKRGENAVIPEGKRFNAVTAGGANVKANAAQ